MRTFDALVWSGRWPFAFLPEFGPRTLAAHLRRKGIGRALVSPLEAVLQPEPGPANRALLLGTRRVAGLVPVPILNPALANWREELATCAADGRVRAVRVLPNYHGWRLTGRAGAQLAEELGRRGLRLAVQVRLVDERHEFHAMRLKGVSVGEMDRFLRRHPALPVLASGLTRPELFALAGAHPQLLADLAWVEWHETLRHVLERVPERQLVLASHTPFLITGAARAKVEKSGLGRRVLVPIAAGNLERWLQAENRGRRMAAERDPFLPEELPPSGSAGRAAWRARSKAIAEFARGWR